MQMNKDNTHPWVLCDGSPTAVSSAVLVCQRKILTKEIGKSVFSVILTLMAVHYMYDFAYNPWTQQVLEFLQEKLLGDCLPASRKPSAAYSRLFRALYCIQQKITDGAEADDESGEG